MSRCPSTHNPGRWPYIARCVRPEGHPRVPEGVLLGDLDEMLHIDGYGEKWEVGGPFDESMTDLPLETARVVVTPDDVRDELTALECGHCGDIATVAPVVFPEGTRYLCRPCRSKVLSWI